MAERNPRLTHVALYVADADATRRFYEEFVGLHVVHERVDDGIHVIWLSEAPSDPDFVIVALGVAPQSDNKFPPRLAHFGYDLPSRLAVDAVAARAEAAGILLQGPVYAGAIVGYYCMVTDPDGNLVEFSHGQPIKPRDLPHID